MKMGAWSSRRLRCERVRFGVPLDQVCKHDIIPRPLLSMVLKLNKDAPYRKNVFRAPGHQASVKKVIYLLQKGYVINMEEVSVYTIASVVKKFLRKVPGGIFGLENEGELFGVMELSDFEDRFKRISRVISSLSIAAQRILVMLFGTFRAVADSATWEDTGMTSEAVGVSVAPSVFRSCVSGGKMATMEDVIRFKMATRVTKFLIDQFGHSSLFSQPCYDYYTRMTGRAKPGVRDWRRGIYTSVAVIPPVHPPRISHQRNASDNHTDTLEQQSSQSDSSPLSPDLSSSDTPSSTATTSGLTLAQLKSANQHAERTRELSYLPLVHERQVARLRTRLEWYNSPSSSPILSCTFLERSSDTSQTTKDNVRPQST